MAALASVAVLAVSACTSGSTSSQGAGPATVTITAPTSTSNSASSTAVGTSSTTSAATTTGAPATSGPTTSGPTTSGSSTAPTTTSPAKKKASPVHVSLFEDDVTTYGVAIPIIVYFSKKVTSAVAFDKATKVTVNGKVVHGAWYWEPSSRSDQAMEAHYRLADYWPANSTVAVDLPVQGLSAGKGLAYDDDLTQQIKIGDRHTVKVDGTPGVDSLKAYSNGQLVRTAPVSLGKSATPTYIGTALVLGRANPQLMQSAPGDPHPYKALEPWSVRMTYSGEFLHENPKNAHIGTLNTSHGCTNLHEDTAKWFFRWSYLGDPVTWKHTGTSKVVPIADGWGDWNVSFSQYQQGGLLPS